ncbi:MAG: hypothetical protein NTX11_01240 [Candidatus Saccharibacteria bacterium]|nr:hypothetical protein [Candidatus Saccharibacteria bacterium]
MKLFKRKTPITNPYMPPEVQAYAASEHRERMGMAWIVGIVSLIVSTILLVSLFFGGRWVYRKIAGTNTNKPTPTVSEPKELPSSDTSEAPAVTPKPTTPAPTPTTTLPAPSTPATDPSLTRTGPDLDL